MPPVQDVVRVALVKFVTLLSGPKVDEVVKVMALSQAQPIVTIRYLIQRVHSMVVEFNVSSCNCRKPLPKDEMEFHTIAHIISINQ